jgi:hypothetical protein
VFEGEKAALLGGVDGVLHGDREWIAFRVIASSNDTLPVDACAALTVRGGRTFSWTPASAKVLRSDLVGTPGDHRP